VTLGRRGIGRALSWGLAIVALGFVVWVIPLRDRCWDPRAPGSTRVAVTRTHAGCVLHLSSGDVTVDADECAGLRCEPGVLPTLAGARLGVLTALLALYASGTFAWAARWRSLLGFADVDLSVAQVWRLSVEAQAGGILLPGGIGGDAFRIASVVARPPRPGRARAPTSIVVASVLLDRAIGLSLIAAVAGALGFAFAGRAVGADAGVLLAALAAIPVGVFAGLALLRGTRGLPTLPVATSLRESRIGRAVEAWAAPVLSYLRDPRAPAAIARAVGWSLLVAASQLLVIRGLVFALGASPTAEKWVYVGAAMAFIVGAIPALPGGWGTADATYVFFFALAGLRPSVGLAVCLLYRLFWYLSGIVGAILHLTRPSAAAGAASADSLGKT
jgi:uncharacterized membrane protein YbhN (UPF0104 family)